MAVQAAFPEPAGSRARTALLAAYSAQQWPWQDLRDRRLRHLLQQSSLR